MTTSYSNEVLEKYTLEREGKIYTFCVSFIPSDLYEVVSHRSKEFLSDQEQFRFKELKMDRRRRSYLLGRFAAKKALVAMKPSLHPSQISIHSDVFGAPILMGAHLNGLSLSLSHTDAMAVSVVFDTHCSLGVDVEMIDPERLRILRNHFSTQELDLIKNTPHEAQGLTLLWTAHEALAKALGVGMLSAQEMYEVKSVIAQAEKYLGEYLKVAAYSFISKKIQNMIMTLAYPRGMLLKKVEQ